MLNRPIDARAPRRRRRRRQLAGGDDAGKMGGDEGDVEAADEEAQAGEQPVAPVGSSPGRNRLHASSPASPLTAGWPAVAGAAAAAVAGHAGSRPPAAPAARSNAMLCSARPPSRSRGGDRACAIGTNTNCPNEPPALTMPLAMPRRWPGRCEPRGRREQHRRAGETGTARGQHADREDQAERWSSSAAPARCRSRPAARPSEQHPPGAVCGRPGCRQTGCVSPHQSWPNGEGQADARQPEAGGRS